MIPLAFVLMIRRRNADYVAVFNNIKDLFPCGRIAVTEIQSDFEAAVWSAVKEVFPQVTHIGCHFHWCQAQIRRVKNSFS